MKVLKYFGIGIGAVVLIAFTGLLVIGSRGPDTSIYFGRQIPHRFLKEIRSLELIGAEEEIKYFYSDALTDIKEGMYFVTNKNLVLYSSEWEEPKTILIYSDIFNVEPDYNDSFFEDSMILIDTLDYTISLPLSSEYGRDRKFVEFILEKMQEGESPAEVK